MLNLVAARPRLSASRGNKALGSFAESPPEPTFALLSSWCWDLHSWPCISTRRSKLDGHPPDRRCDPLSWHWRGTLIWISVALPHCSIRRSILLQAATRRLELRIGPKAVESIVFRRLFHPHSSNAVKGTVITAGIGRVPCGIRRAATSRGRRHSLVRWLISCSWINTLSVIGLGFGSCPWVSSPVRVVSIAWSIAWGVVIHSIVAVWPSHTILSAIHIGTVRPLGLRTSSVVAILIGLSSLICWSLVSCSNCLSVLSMK